MSSLVPFGYSRNEAKPHACGNSPEGHSEYLARDAADDHTSNKSETATRYGSGYAQSLAAVFTVTKLFQAHKPVSAVPRFNVEAYFFKYLTREIGALSAAVISLCLGAFSHLALLVLEKLFTLRDRAAVWAAGAVIFFRKPTFGAVHTALCKAYLFLFHYISEFII